MLKEKPSVTSIFDFSSTLNLFRTISPRTKGYIDTKFVLGVLDSKTKCFCCKKDMKKGSLTVSLVLDNRVFCKKCSKEVKVNNVSIVPNKATSANTELALLAETVYRGYVTKKWQTGVDFYTKPLETLREILESGKYISVEEFTCVVNTRNKVEIKHEDVIWLLFYIYTRLINIKRKIVYKKSTLPIGLHMQKDATIHPNYYIEDVFCLYTSARMQPFDTYERQGIEYVTYKSPSMWGRVFELKDNILLYERK